MIRTKGEPGTGDVVQAVRHMRIMNSEISRLVSLRKDQLFQAAKELGALAIHALGLPVNWAPLSAAQAIQNGIDRILQEEGIL